MFGHSKIISTYCYLNIYISLILNKFFTRQKRMKELFFLHPVHQDSYIWTKLTRTSVQNENASKRQILVTLLSWQHYLHNLACQCPFVKLVLRSMGPQQSIWQVVTESQILDTNSLNAYMYFALYRTGERFDIPFPWKAKTWHSSTMF